MQHLRFRICGSLTFKKYATRSYVSSPSAQCSITTTTRTTTTTHKPTNPSTTSPSPTQHQQHQQRRQHQQRPNPKLNPSTTQTTSSILPNLSTNHIYSLRNTSSPSSFIIHSSIAAPPFLPIQPSSHLISSHPIPSHPISSHLILYQKQ